MPKIGQYDFVTGSWVPFRDAQPLIGWNILIRWRRDIVYEYMIAYTGLNTVEWLTPCGGESAITDLMDDRAEWAYINGLMDNN